MYVCSLIPMLRCVSKRCFTSAPVQRQVNVQRQKSAFPPNYVHSLDSTHMMLTATACRRAGVEFAGTVKSTACLTVFGGV